MKFKIKSWFLSGFVLLLISESASAQWTNKQEITVSNKGESVQDAVVAIELNQQNFDFRKANSDGSDIRFSTNARSIKADGLHYWIESWNKDGKSLIWLKIPKLAKNSTTRIYLFTGNNTAKAISNGFSTFLFFDDFEDDNYQDKWTNISIGSVVEQDGLLKIKEKNGETGIITANFDVTGKMIVRTAYQREKGERHWVRTGIAGWNHWLCWGDFHTKAGYDDGYLMFFNNEIKDLLSSTVTLHPDADWYNLTMYYDGTNLAGVRNGKDKGELKTVNQSSKLGFTTLDDDAYDTFSHVSVSNLILPEPVIAIGKLTSCKLKQ